MAITNYTTYVTELANLLVVDSTTNANYVTQLPNFIDYAEQRIYRDLDILNTVQNATTSFSTGTRTLQLPSTAGTFYVINEIYAITPAAQTSPDLGTRNTLTPVSRPFLDALYPSSNGSALPAYFAMTTQSSIVVGPWPDQTYTVEVSATIRPTPLSSTNVTTLLTTYFPDLFMAASMVFGSGYLQNYSPAADNPQQAVNWESQYQGLLRSAQVEEARKKFNAEGWSSKQPSQIATPPRT